MSYAAFGRAHKPVCHFKLAGHPARVCRHLAELATQVWPAERPSGTIELPATPHIMHHAPCTMHRLTVSCTAHGAPCTTGVYHRVLGTVHYALRTLRHTTSLMGPFRRSLHAFHHHASSQSLSPGHRYTVLVCMSGTMPYPDGMIARACGCVFYWLLRSFPFLGQSQSTS